MIILKPFQAQFLPVEYKVDKELLNLLSESSQRYGEYKSLLDNLNFDSSFFLDSALLNESYKSTQIEGTQISQNEMYYLKYLKPTDDSREIQNLKQTIQFAYQQVVEGNKIDVYLVNQMHRILLDSVRGNDRQPRQIRSTQNWIAPRGVGIEGAIFVPPAPQEIYPLLQNLYEYMNDAFVDPLLVNIALTHAQFETIHPYSDGNGRLGRALIPIQLAMLEMQKPILFMSEILELYKPSYQRYLMEYRKGNYRGYLKFFSQCIIDQCNAFILRLHKIKTIYEEDMKTIEQVHSGMVYKVMPVIMSQIVFTKKEIEDLTGVSKATVSRIINRLEELEVITKDDSVMKKGYKYKKIYDLFVGK
ncbi:Fic family protein [Faecalicoccus pleomorphus]|uniref:Fic family protein n=1 Tax=Faecalicoccus pleomorphus TaxID=1323 RepID=UPI003A7F6224